MHRNEADFTLTFRGLCDAAQNSRADARVRKLFADPAAYDQWAAGWRSLLADEPGEDRATAMRNVNPAYIPRNHRVEQAIAAAVGREDYSVFARLLSALSQPYTESDSFAELADPPRPEERVIE